MNKQWAVIIIFVAMASSSVWATVSGIATEKSERIRFTSLYRADHNLLKQTMDNCIRYKLSSVDPAVTCDGAVRGYATMSSGAECQAAEAVGRELGLLAESPAVNLPVKKK